MGFPVPDDTGLCCFSEGVPVLGPCVAQGQTGSCAWTTSQLNMESSEGKDDPCCALALLTGSESLWRVPALAAGSPQRSLQLPWRAEDRHGQSSFWHSATEGFNPVVSHTGIPSLQLDECVSKVFPEAIWSSPLLRRGTSR